MVKILLDSSSDGIHTHPLDYYVPLTVDIDGRCYKDGIDLRAQRFYKLLTSAAENIKICSGCCFYNLDCIVTA